ncbi:MAG TPA: hypothetical protein VH143_24570, partial [Kofleriaceae bacterium]|nr:hypothetical protein [Kofleriaceae bacterium]
MRLPGVGLGVLLLGACGGHAGDGPPIGDGPQRMIDAPSSIDSTTPTADAWQWQTLITNDWSGTGPAISCASMIVHQDMWIDGLRSSAMTEENDHQFLILTTDQTFMTSSTCTSGRPLGPDDELLYGAGLGQNEVDLPTGMAVHITPAANNHLGVLSQTYLVLYDHLAGAGSGTSSIDVHAAEQADVQHDVDLVLAGQA